MARVVINRSAMTAFVNTDPGMQRALSDRANALMSEAIANSPVGATRSRLPVRGGRKSKTKSTGPLTGASGYFRRHFELRRYRGGWRIWNTDAFAHLVEWGSVNNATYAPLRRAIRSSGLRYVPNPESRGA